VAGGDVRLGRGRESELWGLIVRATEDDLFVEVTFDTDGAEYGLKYSPEIVIFENSLYFEPEPM
jgi:hypothetical protein